MFDNWEVLKSKRLLELTLPGSHNAGNTQALSADRVCQSDYRYQQYLDSAAPGEASADQATFDAQFIPWNVNHEGTIVQQLSMGARFFHMKLCNFNAPGSTVMDLRNVFSEHRGYTVPRSLQEDIEDMRRFLMYHPREIVVLGLNNLYNNASSSFELHEVQALAVAVQEEFAKDGLLTMTTNCLASKTLSQLAFEERRVGIFMQGAAADLPEGVLPTADLLTENWGPPMASGDLAAAQAWLVEDMRTHATARGRFYVLQANPNNAEARMYELLRSGKLPHSLYEWEEKFLFFSPLFIKETVAANPSIRINAISTDFLGLSKPYGVAMELMGLPARPPDEVKPSETNPACLNPAVIEGRFGDVVPEDRYAIRAAHVMQRHGDRWLSGHSTIGHKCWPNQADSSTSALLQTECETAPASADGRLFTTWEGFPKEKDLYAPPGATGSCQVFTAAGQGTNQGRMHARLWGDMLRRKYLQHVYSPGLVPQGCPAGSIALHARWAHADELTLQTLYLALCGRLPTKEEFPPEATLVGYKQGQQKGTPWYLQGEQCGGRMGHDLRDLKIGADAQRARNEQWAAQVQAVAAEAAAATGRGPPPNDRADDYLDAVLDCVVVHACTGLKDTPPEFLDSTTGLPNLGNSSLFAKVNRLHTADRLYGFKYWQSWQVTHPELYTEFVAREYGYYFAVLSDQLRAAAAGDARAPKLTVDVMARMHISIQLAFYELHEEASLRPPYLSALVHEVYEEKDTKNLVMRVLYNGKAVRVCKKPSSFPLCPLEEWEALITKYVPKPTTCPALYAGYEFLAGVPGGVQLKEMVARGTGGPPAFQLPEVPAGGIVGTGVLLALAGAALCLTSEGAAQEHRKRTRGARMVATDTETPLAAVASGGGASLPTGYSVMSRAGPLDGPGAAPPPAPATPPGGGGRLYVVAGGLPAGARLPGQWGPAGAREPAPPGPALLR